MYLDWGNWLYGLFAGCIGGAANAVSGAVAALVVDAKDFSAGSAHSFKLMAAIFCLTFLKDAALYLTQHPLPTVKTVTTVETVEKQVHPTATVTTTVEQTTTAAAGVSTEKP